jgi:tetratricopeptide (TPR) repeat protein
MQFKEGIGISDRKAGDVSPPASGPAESDSPAAGQQSKTSSPPHLTTLQNAVLIAGVVFMIAVWIAGGWAFFDSFRHPPPAKPAPSTVEKSAPSLAEKSPPSAAEKSPPSVAEKPSPEAKESESARPAVVATDNPPKPPEPQPPPPPESPPTPPAVTPPVASASSQTGQPSDLREANETPPVGEDRDVIDPAARELITQGWALYSLPYTSVRWQDARRNFKRAMELDSRSSEARIGLASILSTKLADGWSPVLQEDMPRAEHLLLEAIDKGGVSNQAAAHFTLGVLRQLQTRLPEAQSEFETAIFLDPNNARTYLHLGETLLYLGQPEAGVPPLEQAIRLRPDGPNLAITYWALGTCQLLLGRVDQAIDLLQTARAANARLWVPYFYLAGAYGLKGDLDRARSALGESLRLKPALRSVARMRAENPWLTNPQYWALQEKTLNFGLRRAGLPDQ